MDWKLANEEERAVLKRIVALLLSLAEMAVQAGTRAVPIRVFVLWLVLRAEAAARSLVTTAPAPCPFHHAGASRADAMRLARRLRNLARALDRQATAIGPYDGDAEPAPADFRRTGESARTPGLTGRPAFGASMWDVFRITGIPDTS